MTSRSSALAGSALMLRTRSTPFTSGSSMSMIASSNRSLRAAAVRSSASAAAPFSASPTRMPRLAGQVDRAAHHFAQLLGDAEAEPGAPVTAGGRAVGLGESIKDVPLFVG